MERRMLETLTHVNQISQTERKQGNFIVREANIEGEAINVSCR